MLTAPAITSVNPAYPVATGSAQAFTINGSNFASGDTVTLVDGGGVGTTFNNISISSQTSTQIVINPNFGTAQDVWGVELKNSSGSVISNEFFFATTPSGVSPPNRFGVDYSDGRPGGAALQAAGSNFVVRYVDYVGNPKDITLSEAQTLLGAGQQIVIVFESTATEMENGYNAGVADAQEAASEAVGAGAPSNFFCYFAADFDATTSTQFSEINAYLQGAASVLGVSRVGIYGGYYTIQAVFTNSTVYASKGWQTVAWSDGNVYPGISLYQYANTILSDTSDVDMGIGSNYGQWTPAGLSASATGIQTISVSWSTMGAATGYTLDRATSSSGPWTQVYSGSSASYTDSGLQFGTKYYYEVCGTNGSGSTSFSSSVSATTLSGVPTGLAATATGSASISLSWNTVTGATTYTLQRATSANGTYTQVYSGSTASYSDTGLQANTTYYYEVKSSTSTGSSAYSSSVSATTYPATPTGLAATATGPASISVSWSTVAGATSYTLQRATSANGTYTQVYSGSTASYSDSGLQAGTTYYYEVKSSNSSGSSAFSSSVSAITYPATPTGLAATANGAQSVSVSWSTVAGATSYTLQRSTSANGTYTQVYSGSTASYPDSGLQAGTTYYYEVKSSNSSGSSAFSSSVSAITYPATPTGLAATANDSQSISVSWSTVTGATSYTLQRATSANGTYSQVYSGSTASYPDSGLQAGTTYYYEVEAGNSSGNSAYSSSVSAITYPVTPTGLTAAATDAQSIAVSWNTVTGATSYSLQRSTSANGTYTQVYSGSTASYADSGLQSGTTYYYEVCANNSSGSSAFSSSVSAITYPATPTGLAATANDSQSISVSWSTVTGATSYTLQRATSANGTYSQVYSGSTASYPDSGLQAGTTYYYEVKSSNSSGGSAYSSSVSATTYPVTPTGLTAAANDSQSISVSWNTVTGATSYTLQRATSANGTYTQVYSGSTASYPDSGLQAGTTYYYEVEAGNSSGNSAYSSSVSTITYPATPTGLTAAASGPQSILISWSAMTGATTYSLQRATSPNGPWTQISSDSNTSCSDSGLPSGTTYYYEVSSGNSSGNSAYSSSVSATPSPTVTITTPSYNQAVTTFPITVSGTATDSGGAGLSNVTVDNTANGSSAAETLSGTSASYSITGITLVPGSNVIDVESFDTAGYHSTVATVTVNYSPPMWTGGGEPSVNWSAAANWGGTAIAPGNDLVFAGSTGLSNTNDLAAGTQFVNLTFSSTAGAFTLGGNSVNFSGVITNYSTNTETIALPLGGTSGLTKTGPGPVVLSGANNYTGSTVLTAGLLQATSPAALPDGANLMLGVNVLAMFG